MARLVLFKIIVELLVQPIRKRLGYLTSYKKNVKKLKIQVDELNNTGDRLDHGVESAKKNGQKIMKDVLDWQVEVRKTYEEAGTFKSQCWRLSRYSLSRKAKKMTRDVVMVLQRKGEKFESGIIAFPPSPGWPQPFSATGESNEISLIVEDVLETLKDDRMYLIGIHGVNRTDMKGLLSNISKRTKDRKQFEELVIAYEHNERNIQDEIAYGLRLKFDSNLEAARRHRLKKRLADDSKKLLILDDVCETLNLEVLGIPFGGGEENKTCKIIVMSSNKVICEEMNTQKTYKLVHTKMLLFGGHNGDLWDDKAHTTIRSIIVVYNAVGICSFQTEYDDKGHSSMSLNHEFVRKSTNDDEEKIKIELKYPDEFLISVSGYYGSVSNHVVLHSLKFESNKQTFGPFGPETGEPFTSPSDTGKVNGFYVRSGHDSLDGIGLYYEPISSNTGPEHRTLAFGGPGGGNSFDDGRYTTIRKLEIEVDNVINSIRTEYDSNGRSRWTNLYGTSRGGHMHTVELDYPGEFMISVSGYIRADILTGITVIGSLTVETNRNKYGPFGIERGEAFSFPSCNSGKIVGFHGKCGWYIDSLGAYIEPFPAQNTTTSFAQVGGDGGTHWDDGAAHTTIRQIILKVCHAKIIKHLRVEYDKNGRSKWSNPHGDPSTLSEVMVKLDYPGEFLISMSGTTRVLWEGCRVVSSLKFRSNRMTYGPYGDESGDYFSTSLSTSGKIVGFYGKSGDNLYAIGAHFEPFSIHDEIQVNY